MLRNLNFPGLAFRGQHKDFPQIVIMNTTRTLFLIFLCFTAVSVKVCAQRSSLSASDSLYYSEMYRRAMLLKEKDLDSAISYYKTLDRFLSERNVHDKRMRVLLDMGNTYLHQGHSDRAMETYLKILEEARSQKDPEYQIYAEVSIAGAYLDSRDYEKALQQYQKIREEYPLTNAIPHRIRAYSAIYNNEGIANENLGRFAEAEALYQKSIDLARELDDFYLLANSISNMGLVKSKAGDHVQALEWHKKALSIRQEEGFKMGISQSLAHLGAGYRALGDENTAQEHYERSLEIAMELGAPKQIIEAAIPLKELYLDRADYQKAFEMQEYEMQARSKILDDESVKKQERLKARYEYELEKKIEAENRRFRETVYQFSFGILALLFLMALALYFLQKSKTRQSELLNENIRKEKQILHKELEYKNKKLMSNVMFLLEKNELIASLIERLRDIKNTAKPQSDKMIADTILSLRQHHNHQSWEDFDVCFQEVHSEFYSKLAAQYQLTPNEMKLAAFTKLNLSSKEISALTGQSTRTIDVGRYRLRKKLGISNSETNLTTFLNNL